MDRRGFLRLIGGTAALPLGLSRLGGPIVLAQDTADLTALGLPELTVSVNETGYQVAPATTPAGWTLLTFDNQGAGNNSADIMMLPPGETMESLLEVLMTVVESPTAAPPPWIYQATFAGAPFAAPDASAQAVVLLSAGEWAVFSPTPLTPATLTVTAGDAAAIDPADLTADVEVTMREFAFVGLDSTIPAGRRLWRVTNEGQQPHFITWSQLPDGTTQAQFMEELTAMMSSPPSPEAAGPPGPPIAGGCSTLSAGQSLYLGLDLTAGTYGAVCFFPDPQTGAPHLAMGMAQVFTVG